MYVLLHLMVVLICIFLKTNEVEYWTPAYLFISPLDIHCNTFEFFVYISILLIAFFKTGLCILDVTQMFCKNLLSLFLLFIFSFFFK